MLKQSWSCVYIPSLVYSSFLRYLSNNPRRTEASIRNCATFACQQFALLLLESLSYSLSLRLLFSDRNLPVFRHCFHLFFSACKTAGISSGLSLLPLLSAPLLPSISHISLALLFVMQVYHAETRNQPDLWSFSVRLETAHDS